MANVSSVTKYFSTAEENSVAMTLGGSILAGAATVPVNGMTNYTDNQVVVFVVDPATPSLKQTFTGTKSGSNVINCVWTELPTGGVNVPHSAGATVIDYVTATDWDMLTTGITKSLNQDGSMITAAVQTALNISTPATSGWTISGFAPSAVAALGNRSYSLTFAATNLTTTMSAGMRLQTTRTVAAPTQCTSLNGTTQYYSKTSPSGYTFTDSFTYSAWVKPTSYALGTIIGRFSTTGSMLQMNASGQLLISAKDAGTTDSALSYQSLPLNKWSHVAMTMVVATNTVTAYIDGVAVPTAYTNGTTTAVTQAGSLEIGGNNGGTNPFPGKIAQAAVYNAVLSNATILASMTQGLAGTETSLISAYSFNNSINDLNANANNLTANGSAVATATDSPFGGQADGTISSTLDYGIITKTAFSTNTTLTVQVPEGCTIPTSGGVSAVSYSTVGVPYGFPKQKEKWRVLSHHRTNDATTSNATYGAFQSGGWAINVPVGEWDVGYRGDFYSNLASDVTFNLSSTALTGKTVAQGHTSSPYTVRMFASSASAYAVTTSVTQPQSLAAATSYVVYSFGATTAAGLDGTEGTCEIFAEPTFL